MSQEKIDIYTIAKILGHKDIRMTMRYAHHNVESLRHGVDALVKPDTETEVSIVDSENVADVALQSVEKDASEEVLLERVG